MLCADLKGSMELLADRDPEEAGKLLDLVLERMMESVHRYEGTVNQVMGDGIMATAKRWPWPTSSTCGRSPRTATSILASCCRRHLGPSELDSIRPPLRRSTARWA